ncbi:InlB B-repeat-containing protein [Adlercreutzia sp. ZJ154]|uniref:InlB B-repeat-containing protein n=1 Tax=Adlercreutzia sp. ZJ154 TaxID=2709790 RepID=UPI0013EB04F4|nr:InlB B-repeat-containing protein [Adlercreutzia sp. ZJ154]
MTKEANGMLRTATLHDIRKPIAAVIASVIALVCALVVVAWAPSGAFATEIEYTQDLGVFVGANKVEDGSAGLDEEHFRDPSSVGASANVDLGIYVGSPSESEQITGSDNKDTDHFRDPSTVGASANVDLGIYVGSPSESEQSTGAKDEEHFRDPSTVGATADVDLGIYVGGASDPADSQMQNVTDGGTGDGNPSEAGKIQTSTDLGIYVGDNGLTITRPGTTDASGNTSVGITTDLGIYVGNGATDTNITGTDTPNLDEYSTTTDCNVDLGIYVGELSGETEVGTDTPNPDEYGTTIDHNVDLGIYVGDGATDPNITDTDTPKLDEYSTTVDREVNLGIYVGGTIDSETGTGAVNPSTTLAIRVVNPEVEPDVTEADTARTTWQLGDASGAKWADNTTNVKSSFVKIPAGGSVAAGSELPGGGNPVATYQHVSGWQVVDKNDGATNTSTVAADGLGTLTLQGKHDYTFTPLWEGKEYSVTLNPNGGNVYGSTSSVTKTYKYPDAFTTPAYPDVWRAAKDANTAYEFAGWYKSLDDSGKGVGSAVTSVTAESGITNLHAAWNEITISPDDPPTSGEYAMIKFVISGGPAGAPSAPPDMYVKYGNKLAVSSLPQPASVEGYTFKGWYTNEACTADAVDIDSVTENITFYGRWQNNSNATVTFNANGGSFDGGAPTTTVDVPIGDALDSVVGFTYPKVTRTGYLFAGWYTGTPSDGGVQLGSEWDISTPINSDLTLYAKWIALVNVDVPVEAQIQLVHTGTGAAGDEFVVNAKTFGQFQNRSDVNIGIYDVTSVDDTAAALAELDKGATNATDANSNYSKSYLTILAKKDGSAVVSGESGFAELKTTTLEDKLTYTDEVGETHTVDLPASAYQISTDLSQFSDNFWIYKYQLNAEMANGPGDLRLTSRNSEVMYIEPATGEGTALVPGVLPVYYGVTFDTGFDITKADLEDLNGLKKIATLKYTIGVYEPPASAGSGS